MSGAPIKQQPEFHRRGLFICHDRASYTGQQAERIPNGLIGVVGTGCTSLDLSFNKLITISNIKEFEKLQELVLDNNGLRDLKTLPKMPTLTTLSLNNNKIQDMDAALEHIGHCCSRISYVSLLGNPGYPDQLTDRNDNGDDYKRYRLYAIYVLPKTLRFLDSRAISVDERGEAQRRGRFSKIVRPNLSTELVNNCKKSLDNEFDEAYFYVNYTPLPTTAPSAQNHKGAYGKCRYRYSGKNSEGNRFISNNDL